ncbi:hypothetical protein [Microbacterium gorillae]|uniref:hypothetical protein n=1 Tax=Microbacterium gorillae TaxID=1231063 RepID=UPI00058CA64F|nr:hypothetical protein [Microbacterium gorillae]
MQWDDFFAGLEGQLAAEWEAERAALASETERLRVAALELRTRLAAVAAEYAPLSLDSAAGTVRGTLRVVGADWVGLEDAPGRLTAVPLRAVRGVGLTHPALLRSTMPVPTEPLRERFTFGFLARDLARRRLPVRVTVDGGSVLSGTIDRAGRDHIDVALHDPDRPRRAAEVTGYRIIPVAAIAHVRIEDADRIALTG